MNAFDQFVDYYSNDTPLPHLTMTELAERVRKEFPSPVKFEHLSHHLSLLRLKLSKGRLITLIAFAAFSSVENCCILSTRSLLQDFIQTC
jgi:hypothetical protein